MPERILRRPVVSERTGLPVPTLYRLIENGLFPRPFKIGVRAVGWKESDIDNWIQGRITAGENAAAPACAGSGARDE